MDYINIGVLEMRFLVDVMLGKLGRWMRMMGFDTEIASDELNDKEVIEKAEKEDRVIITRDTDIDKMNTGVKTVLLDTKNFEEQIKDVFDRLNLEPRFPEESRCSNCNGELEKTGEDNWVCKRCGQRYWKGSHWKRIEEIREKLGG